MSTTKQANSSAAGWALITEGVTASRVEAHRLRKLLQQSLSLVEVSSEKEHLYQVAGDLIMSIPKALERLERNLDRTSYALAVIGEDHLKDRLSLDDRAQVEDGVEGSKPWGSSSIRKDSVEIVARLYESRSRGK